MPPLASTRCCPETAGRLTVSPTSDFRTGRERLVLLNHLGETQVEKKTLSVFKDRKQQMVVLHEIKPPFVKKKKVKIVYAHLHYLV